MVDLTLQSRSGAPSGSLHAVASLLLPYFWFSDQDSASGSVQEYLGYYWDRDQPSVHVRRRAARRYGGLAFGKDAAGSPCLLGILPGGLYRIDPFNPQAETGPIGTLGDRAGRPANSGLNNPRALTYGGDAHTWYCIEDDFARPSNRELWRVDPFPLVEGAEQFRRIGSFPAGMTTRPLAMAYGNGRLFVGTAGGKIWNIDPADLDGASNAVFDSSIDWLGATHDGTNFYFVSRPGEVYRFTPPSGAVAARAQRIGPIFQTRPAGYFVSSFTYGPALAELSLTVQSGAPTATIQAETEWGPADLSLTVQSGAPAATAQAETEWVPAELSPMVRSGAPAVTVQAETEWPPAELSLTVQSGAPSATLQAEAARPPVDLSLTVQSGAPSATAQAEAAWGPAELSLIVESGGARATIQATTQPLLTVRLMVAAGAPSVSLRLALGRPIGSVDQRVLYYDDNGVPARVTPLGAGLPSATLHRAAAVPVAPQIGDLWVPEGQPPASSYTDDFVYRFDGATWQPFVEPA